MQQYETRVADVFVISSNEAILSCSLPSHNAEFLTITSWVTNEGVNIDKNALSGPVNPISQFLRTISGNCSSKCKGENAIHEVYFSHFFSAVMKSYEIFVRDNFGLLGNTVLLKCDVPFTSFVFVHSWVVLDPPDQYEYTRDNYGIYS